MITKLIPVVQEGKGTVGYSFWCPGCEELHRFSISGNAPVWTFNGDLQNPSFSPSLRVRGIGECHLYVQNGQIAYCSDCTHELKGKTVPLVDFDVERWCPVNNETKNETNVAGTNAPQAPAPAAENAQPASSPGVTQIGSPTPGTETSVSKSRSIISDADRAELESFADQFGMKIFQHFKTSMDHVLATAEEAATRIKASIQEGFAAAEAAKAKAVANANAPNASTPVPAAQPQTLAAQAAQTAQADLHETAVQHIMKTMGYIRNLAIQTVAHRGGPAVVLAQRDADAAAAAAKASESSAT